MKISKIEDFCFFVFALRVVVIRLKLRSKIAPAKYSLGTVVRGAERNVRSSLRAHFS